MFDSIIVQSLLYLFVSEVLWFESICPLHTNTHARQFNGHFTGEIDLSIIRDDWHKCCGCCGWCCNGNYLLDVILALFDSVISEVLTLLPVLLVAVPASSLICHQY